MHYFFESTEFWDYTFLDKKNLKPLAITFKDKELEDDAKIERQKKYRNTITFCTMNNVKCKIYIRQIYLVHISHKFQAVMTD